MTITKSSAQETTSYFRINNSTLIVTCNSQLLNGSVRALYKPKGIPSMNKNNRLVKNSTKTLENNKIFQIMYRKYTCLYNHPVENLFGIMKKEMYYGKVYKSFNELEISIKYWNENSFQYKVQLLCPAQN